MIYSLTLPNIRVALEKDSLDVWIGGEKIETVAGFTEVGSEQIFSLHNQEAKILGEFLTFHIILNSSKG